MAGARASRRGPVIAWAHGATGLSDRWVTVGRSQGGRAAMRVAKRQRRGESIPLQYGLVSYHGFVTKPAPRSSGRPRDENRDRELLQAARELLAEIGYDRLTIEAVAARVGAGK